MVDINELREAIHSAIRDKPGITYRELYGMFPDESHLFISVCVGTLKDLDMITTAECYYPKE